MRFAQGIAEQYRVLAAFAVDLPPAHDIADHRDGVGPHEVRLRESGFADEHIAFEGLEGRTGWIGLPFVVAGDDPDFPVMLQPHLRRAQDMAGRMQGDADAAQRERRAVLHRDDIAGVVQALARDSHPWRRHQHAGTAFAQMIAMGMRDHGGLHGFDRIDVEIARRAIQSTLVAVIRGVGRSWISGHSALRQS